MSKRKQIAIMIIAILVMQILFPILSVVFESGITLKSIAVTELTSGDWTYTVNEEGETITIVEYSGTEENLQIPSEIDGYTVTGLGSGRLVDSSEHVTYSVFEYCYLIESIKLPNTLTTIGSMAFLGCDNLMNVELNEGLQTIKNQAFYGCKKIENIIIPSTVTEIENAYEANSFYGCNSLTSITVHSDNQQYCSIDGVLFNKGKTILIAYPSAKSDSNYSIPESVTQIYGRAINNQNLINIHISKNVNNMKGAYWLDSKTNTFAIINCFNLQSITVDEANVNYYSENGILYNKNKTALLLYPSRKTSTYYEIPNTVSSCTTECGDTTINNSHLEKIKLNSIINSPDFLTGNINLKYIDVDSNNTNYMQKDGVLFNKNGSKIVYYPQGRDEQTYTIDVKVTEINAKAFMNCKITEIILPESIITLGDYAFYNCKNLKNVILSNCLTSIGNYVFYNCNSLDNITIPNTVTSIGDYAFYNCDNLISVTIPNNVISIGQKAFYNCTRMKDLIFEENSKIQTVKSDAFSNCASLEDINIPEGITTIASSFNNCPNLKTINIPKSVEALSSYSIHNNGVQTLPQVITINNENPTMSGTWIFDSPDMGCTVIRCYSTATNVINWTKSFGYIYYNIIDLDEDDEKFLYEISEDNEVTITNYIGDEENVEIPDEIQGFPVTSLGRCVGTYKNLSIPSTVKKIGKIYSRNLEQISVDEENQYFTSKDGVLFNKNENELLYYPMGRKDISYNIPEGTTLIGGTTRATIGSTYYVPTAFNGNMNLQSLNIPKSVTKIESSTLNMANLREFLVDSENQKYVAKDKILYKINTNSVEIEEVPTNISGDVELLYGLTKVDTYEFQYNNNLETIVVPTTVTKISHNAFYCCRNLKKLVISPTATELIEKNAANLCFGRVECEEFKVYCEDESIVQKYAKKWGIDYEIIEPIKIEIKQNPSKLHYLKDEELLNLEGGLITITYDDGTSLDLDMTSDLINVAGFNNTTMGSKQIEVKYKGCKASFDINVVQELKELTEITVTTSPSNTVYIEGQNFDTTGMVVTATYNDRTTKEVTNYTVTDGNNLTVGKTSVTISYTENGVTKTTTQGITVVEKVVTGIAVTKVPTNISYIVGQNFDKTGMKVTATYNDGTTKEVTNYTVTDGNNLTVGKTSVTISYTENGVTKTTTQGITVVEKVLTGIAVTKVPTNTSYIAGQNFDKTGMKVTATYNDGTSKEVTTYTVTDGNNLTAGKTNVTISYTENTVTKTTTQGITVNEDHTWNIGEVTKEPTCKDKGEKTYTCTVCNKTKIQEIAETGHKYENGVCVNCGENIFTEESKYYIILSELIGISPNTIIGKFITNIMEKYTVKIMKDNQEVTEGKIATGMQIKIFEKEQEVDSCTAVVTGDTDGNGNADIRDMIKINNYRLYGTTTNFEGAYQTAGDVNRDGKIDIKDMIRINNYRLYNTSI